MRTSLNAIICSLSLILGLYFAQTFSAEAHSSFEESSVCKESPIQSPSECNGYENLCHKRVNQIAWLMSHNATSLAMEGSAPNFLCFILSGTSNISPLATQSAEFTLEKQMQAGVRGFKLPIMAEGEKVWICHPKIIQVGSLRLTGSESCKCDYARRPAEDVFKSMKNFLDNNPREVFMVLLDNYASTQIAVQYLIAAGLDAYAHDQDPKKPWPTLEQLIQDNKRLIIFNSLSFAALDQSTIGAPSWFNNEPDFITSSYDGFYTDSSDFYNETKLCPSQFFNEKKPSHFEMSGIYALGYHGYGKLVGAPIAGSETIAAAINKDVFQNADRCRNRLGTPPSIIQMDYVDIPDVYENLKAVQALNQDL